MPELSEELSGQRSPNLPEWRLIAYAEVDGASNMAIDEAIAEATVEGLVPPTLRFYGWQPPCLSLGRNQLLAEANQERCSEMGVDIVRRPTGGRAILHSDELTYSISGPSGEPQLSGGVLEVYHRISAGLLHGLQALGVAAEETAPPPGRLSTESAACFDVPAAYEITVGGRKLIGSAQARRGGWVLQHGSLPLLGDVGRIVDILVFDDEERREALRNELRRKACTLSETLTSTPDVEMAIGALVTALSDSLQILLLPGKLTDWELDRAGALRGEKYASPEWTAHR